MSIRSYNHSKLWSNFLLMFFLVTLMAIGTPCFGQGFSVDKISNNDTIGNGSPQINSNGHVVWHGYDGSDREIYYFDGDNVTNISNIDSNDYYPQINADGHVVWFGWDESDLEIYYFDGDKVTNISNNDSDDKVPQINADGHVVWQGWDGSDYEIYYFNRTTVTNISNNDFDNYSPQINSNGHVVWQGYDGSKGHIIYYDGTNVTNISNNDINNDSPQINSNGHVVWHGWDGSDYEIYYFDGTTVTNISNNDFNDVDPQINADGHVVWEGNGEIYLAIPIRGIEVVIDYIKDSIADGTLYGVGKGKSANNKLNAFIDIIKAAGDLLESGQTVGGCQQLVSAYLKTDGVSPPPDFVGGPAAEELANKIEGLMTYYGCK